MYADQKQLKRILSNSFEGIIWKIELNEQHGLIAVESRISEEKKLPLVL